MANILGMEPIDLQIQLRVGKFEMAREPLYILMMVARDVPPSKNTPTVMEWEQSEFAKGTHEFVKMGLQTH